MVPVINIFIIESGRSIFQPKFINWSNLNLGIVHRTQKKEKYEKEYFCH